MENQASSILKLISRSPNKRKPFLAARRRELKAKRQNACKFNFTPVIEPDMLEFKTPTLTGVKAVTVTGAKRKLPDEENKLTQPWYMKYDPKLMKEEKSLKEKFHR